MIRPGVVPYATINGLIRVSRSFGAKLPYSPIIWMFGIEEGDKAVEGVAVCSLGVGLAGSRTGRKRCVVSLRASPRTAVGAAFGRGGGGRGARPILTLQ